MFKQKLDKDEFVITAELCPPKGQDVSSFIHKAKIVKQFVDAVNITDNQRAMMRLSSLVAAHLVQEQGIDVIFQMTCRDRNRIALQSDLLGAAALGIKNVLALTGDYVTEGDHKEAKPVFDLDSTQLLEVIAELNKGKDLVGKQLKGHTDFYAGAAVNPAAKPLEPQLLSFERKVASGASFFQTQAIFDLAKFADFMDYAKRFPVKIIAGILLIKSEKMARFLHDNVPGVTIPQELFARIANASDSCQEGIKIAREQIEQFRALCHGVHIMTVGAEDKVVDILK